MMRNEPNEFSILQSPKTNAVFIGETPEQVIGAARVYDNTHPAQTRVEPDYSRLITPAYRIIMGGVTDNTQFMRAISGCKEARNEFERGVGFSGSKVRQIVHLAPNARVLLDAEHEERFREFARRAYDHCESGKLESAWGFEKLYAFSLGRAGSGVDKVLSQYRLPRDSVEATTDDFIAHRADKIFLPKSLMGGVVAAGLRYRNDTMTLEQRGAAQEKGLSENGVMRALRRIFG